MSAEPADPVILNGRSFRRTHEGESWLENSELRDLFMKDESRFVKKGNV
jgi:hypothetical protein